MITLIDALKKCDKEKLWELFKNREEIPNESLRNAKVCFILWLSKITNITPIPHPEIIFLPYMNENFLDVTTIHCEDISSIDFIEHDEEDLMKYTNDELHQLVTDIKLPERYSFMFTSWENILGYNIPENVVMNCGYTLEEIIASISSEMTFFGFTEDKKEEEKDILEERAKECEEMLKKPKEEQEKYFIPFEKVMEDLGWHDDRTEEEKEAERHEMLINMYKTQTEMLKVINLIAKEIGKDD